MLVIRSKREAHRRLLQDMKAFEKKKEELMAY
jgi:hypothetical protein